MALVFISLGICIAIDIGIGVGSGLFTTKVTEDTKGDEFGAVLCFVWFVFFVINFLDSWGIATSGLDFTTESQRAQSGAVRLSASTMTNP